MTLILELQRQPDVYRPSEALAAVVGSGPQTRCAMLRVGACSLLPHSHIEEITGAADWSCLLSAGWLGGSLMKVGVMQAIWAYIKQHRLQNDAHPALIRCDARLKALFREDSLKMATISEKISPHLKPEEPVKLEYTVTWASSDTSSTVHHTAAAATSDRVLRGGLPCQFKHRKCTACCAASSLVLMLVCRSVQGGWAQPLAGGRL